MPLKGNSSEPLFSVTLFFMEKLQAFVILSGEGLTLVTSALKLFTVANSCYQLSWWITFSCHTLPSTQHHIFFKNLIPLFNRKTDVTQSSVKGTSSYWSVSCSKRLSFQIFAAAYTASDNHRSVSFWPTFPPTTHYSFSKLLTNNLVHKLSQISSLLSKWQLVTEKYIHRSQSWVTTRKKYLNS